MREGLGSVLCWGTRSDVIPGVLAQTTATNATVVTVPSDTVQIAVGVSHLCTRESSGLVQCRGLNPARGALGFASNAANISVSTPVTGLTDAIDLVANGWHSCARRKNGDVVCWGYNTQGEVGNANTLMRNTPTHVVGLDP